MLGSRDMDITVNKFTMVSCVTLLYKSRNFWDLFAVRAVEGVGRNI